MKKKLVLLTFLIFSVLSFGIINDNANLFDEAQKKIINEKIEEIKKTRDITAYVNTFNEDIGFFIDEPQKVLLLNLKKISDENYKVEISFSKDIESDDYDSDIDNILKDNGELLETKEYSEYVVTVLDELEEMLEDVKIDSLDDMSLSKHGEEKDNEIFYYYIAGVIILLLLILGIFYKKKFIKRKKLKRDNKN